MKLIIFCLLLATTFAQTANPNLMGIDMEKIATAKGMEMLLSAMMAFSDADMVIESDMFTDEPKILSGDVGFEGIIGIPDTTHGDAVRGSGAGWVDAKCRDNDGHGDGRCHTSALSPTTAQMLFNCNGSPDHMDGYPICFSWPIRPGSLNHEVIEITMIDGTTRTPMCYSDNPNLELNERHCVVFFGDFFNREDPSSPDHYDVDYITVPEGSTLELIGPDGPVSAVGIKYNLDRESSSYSGGAPYFTAAKLNPGAWSVGDGGADDLQLLFGFKYPNDGTVNYGDEVTHTIRLFYSGGMTPNGVRSLMPWEYDDYFTLVLNDGQEINERNTPVTSEGTSVTVLGLADLGGKIDEQDGTPDLCYQTDYDNYIDVSLKINGDPNVIKSLKYFHKGAGLFNPGGPGDNPDYKKGDTFGAYSGEGKPGEIDISFDLDNSRKVTWCSDMDGNTLSLDPQVCLNAYANGLVPEVVFGSLGKNLGLDKMIKATVCGNGDMFPAQQCQQMKAAVGCDSVGVLCPKTCGMCGPKGVLAESLYEQLRSLGVEVQVSRETAIATAKEVETEYAAEAESSISANSQGTALYGFAALGVIGSLYYIGTHLSSDSKYTEVVGADEI